MRANPRWLMSTGVFALAGLLPSCVPVGPAESETAPSNFEALSAPARHEAKTGTVGFARHVKPILEAKCVMCHGAVDAQGGFRLDRRQFAFSEGVRGRRIVPFEPARSPMISRLDEIHAGIAVMPPVGNRITNDEQVILRRWITQGASWPGSESVP
jgi:hypothetical protein